MEKRWQSSSPRNLSRLLKSYKYPWLVKEGDEIRQNPEQLYSAFLARYKLAVMDADTPQRDLVQMGRQVGELAKLLGIKEGNVNHQIDYSPETKALLERCASSYAARHCSHCSPPPTITAEFVDVPQPRLPAAGNSQETP